jgi:hypothetical protein
MPARAVGKMVAFREAGLPGIKNLINSKNVEVKLNATTPFG